MNSVPNFVGDDDERFFRMQMSCYSKALGIIVRSVVKSYQYAESVLRCEGSISEQVRELHSFDHRTVQDAHDLIAAWYRFRRKTERLFPLERDLDENWLLFLEDEATALSREPAFVIGLLDACIHANTEIGYAGEKRAHSVQRVRYAPMTSYVMPRPKLDEIG